MREPIIDGREWVEERLAFLRRRLTDPLSDDERQRVEAEIEALAAESPLACDPTPAWIPSWPFRRKRQPES